MESSPTQNINKGFSIDIIGPNKKKYYVQFSLEQELMNIIISDESFISNYKISLSKEDLYKNNKYLRQFDSIEEIHEFLTGLEDLQNKINIKFDKTFVILTITLPKISKGSKDLKIEIMIPGSQLKENDILEALYEKVKEINILNEKIEYLMKKFCTSGEFELYQKGKKLYDKIIENDDIKNSKIINSEMDLVPISVGIKEKFDKKIKDMRLLYRASKDGDLCSVFHLKCDSKPNIAVFVKSKNGRRFGGFTNVGFNSTRGWTWDLNAFLFSLDHHECYYIKNANKSKIIYDYDNYGPLWGEGYDLYLCDNCLSKKCDSQQESFDYRGKFQALSGADSFELEDYEAYSLTLE